MYPCPGSKSCRGFCICSYALPLGEGGPLAVGEVRYTAASIAALLRTRTAAGPHPPLPHFVRGGTFPKGEGFGTSCSGQERGRPPGRAAKAKRKEEARYSRNSMGSTLSSFLLTAKWTWWPRAFSMRAEVPTAPMVWPMDTCSPALTATALSREEYRVV